jgi:hypothetical protein
MRNISLVNTKFISSTNYNSVFLLSGNIEHYNLIIRNCDFKNYKIFVVEQKIMHRLVFRIEYWFILKNISINDTIFRGLSSIFNIGKINTFSQNELDGFYMNNITFNEAI